MRESWQSAGLDQLVTPHRGSIRVSFIVPVYNEAKTVEQVLRALDALDLDHQIIVVDDGSTDGTRDVLARWRDLPHVSVLERVHRGKGAAIRAAIPYLDGGVTVIQDADLEYDPADVPALIEAIVRGSADVVYGSRLHGGRPQRAYLFWHLVANRFLSLLTGVLYNTTLSDIETGYKAFRTEILRDLRLRSEGFAIEPEITARICRRRLRIYELPISYYGRSYDEGKTIGWQDGIRAVLVLVGIRLGLY